MSVYRLLVGVDEDDDVIREIDIKPDQFFHDLSKAIVKYFGIRGKKEAAFFVSNPRWQKLNEITLGNDSHFENAIDGLITNLETVFKQTKQLIYFNENLPEYTFLVQLEEEVEEQSDLNYPHLNKQTGKIDTGSSFTDDIFDDEKHLQSGRIAEDTEDGFTELE